MNLDKLKNDPVSPSILSYFPLHHDESRNELYRNWLNFSVRPWEQPIDDVKEYFGEKVGKNAIYVAKFFLASDILFYSFIF